MGGAFLAVVCEVSEISFRLIDRASGSPVEGGGECRVPGGPNSGEIEDGSTDRNDVFVVSAELGPSKWPQLKSVGKATCRYSFDFGVRAAVVSWGRMRW